MNTKVELQPRSQGDSGARVTPSWAMLRTLAGIATLSGLLVVLVYQATKPIIAENERILTEKAVFEVLPGAVSKVDFVLSDRGLMRAGEGAVGVSVFAGFAADGQLRGVAFPGAARGYQDVIQFLFGYDPACRCIIGSKVLRSTETPGLGDKIDTDPVFLENFVALDVSLNPEGTALANPIVNVAQGTKTEPWQIDGISGATISVKAMTRALQDAASNFVPMIQRDLATLTAEAP
ncbi:FMN-binding protein [Thiocapsa rosea]|uniref:Ion-translocating oxidoreductase complex subunit G n=1 Tax=Thiocapsa rosea TaxID=69360 RepID=A0A495VBB0_9GAMM|nr:FMN-binding protein [Thiocapsa rosea]RKT46676.1 electron transport complex protein RnfG [Thiocapsa rosea]